MAVISGGVSSVMFQGSSPLTLRMEDEIVGVQTCRKNVLQKHAVGSIDRDERIVSNLGLARLSGPRGTNKFTKIDGVQRGTEIRHDVLNRICSARWSEDKLIRAAAARQDVRGSAGEDDVVSSRPFERSARVVIENEMYGIGSPEVIDRGQRHHVRTRRRGPWVVGHARCERGIDRRKRA